jgi:uncharacterized membrane protein
MALTQILPRTSTRSLILCAAALLLASCGRQEHSAAGSSISGSSPTVSSAAEASVAKPVSMADVPAGVGTLSGGEHSPEALVSAALRAFTAQDTAALSRLMVTKDEWADQLYPEFPLYYPAARDTREETKRFLWENHFYSSVNALMRDLKKVGGRKMELVSLSYRDETQTFKTYTIHQGTLPRVRMEDGSVVNLSVLGSIVEKQGVYKLLSYRDKD